MRKKRPIASRDPPQSYLKAAQLVTGGVNSFGGNKVKKLLIGLCALVFLIGSGLAFAGGNDNEGEPEEEQDQQKCSPTNLCVGYVDNDALDMHTGSFFPTPFAPTAGNPGGTCVAPNCIFIGTPGPNGEFDAGVIKIDNPLPSTPLVVQSVTVDIGPVTGLDPWTTFFPITIPGGGTLILTEDANLFNFDTSDIPPTAAPPPLGTCAQNAFKPLIHVTVGTGTTQVLRTFSDTTQVLNDGGIDGLCPPVHNEGKAYVTLTEVQNKCACEKDSDENGDDNGQNGGQGNGNDE